MNLYIDASSGISGDMFAAALFDMGAFSEKEISDLFLPVFGEALSIKFELVVSLHIRAAKMRITYPKSECKKPDDIHSKINALVLPEEVKKDALAIVSLLSQAEAKIHDKTVKSVHFHEVGAVDTVIDAVLAAYGIYKLGIKECFVSPINVGSGTIKIQHGIFRVPAPATAELLTGFEVENRFEGELTTPTGAAIIKHFCRSENALKGKIKQTGFGAGNYGGTDNPDILRLFLLENEEKKETPRQIQVQTNIDDMSSEIYSVLYDELFKLGALDVWSIPIFSKKNRPAYELNVLVPEQQKNDIVNFILNSTTTFGVRWFPVEREELARAVHEIDFKGHKIRIKQGFLNGVLLKESPEYEDVRTAAKVLNLPFIKLYNEILRFLDTFK